MRNKFGNNPGIFSPKTSNGTYSAKDVFADLKRSPPTWPKHLQYHFDSSAHFDKGDFCTLLREQIHDSCKLLVLVPSAAVLCPDGKKVHERCTSPPHGE
ncbi:uncharacterized protein TrAFT101_009140 [Trichoderma asperellum]|uniref:uncharacterized protein n=1 Tax=Trichoderma asperellum TaxID=101201 RepID=UPI003319C89D|nr:hypothetical protein TrAFT101_009140 [Trichoderma asperellum]